MIEYKNKLEISFVESIIENNVSEIINDGIEISIDNFIENDLLKSIPIVKIVLAISKGALSIRDYLFLKKIIYFLNEVEKIDIKKREKFINEIKEKDEFSKVGLKLIEIIDKVFFEYKAKIIGLLFVNFLEKETITQFDFFRLSEMIIESYESDLKYFFTTEENEIGETGDEVEHLLVVGFYERRKSSFGDRILESTKPVFSFYGKILKEVGK